MHSPVLRRTSSNGRIESMKLPEKTYAWYCAKWEETYLLSFVGLCVHRYGPTMACGVAINLKEKFLY